jgi:MFS family permease
MLCGMTSGYANAFMSGSFTVNVVGPALGPSWVGYVLATRNLTGLVSGVVLGRLSDHFGRYPCCE